MGRYARRENLTRARKHEEETTRSSGEPLKHRRRGWRKGLITCVARSSFTYRRRYTLAYFKPAIFQHLRCTSTSNLHEATIRGLFRTTFARFHRVGKITLISHIMKPLLSKTELTRDLHIIYNIVVSFCIICT